MYRIVGRQVISPLTFVWEVEAPDVARSAQPGQFAMVRLHEGSERIPLTIADYDRDRGTVTLVVQAVGKTTREMMSHYAAGDAFEDFAGPLGRPQEIQKLGHVVLVGGGVGVAPLYLQTRAFAQAGNRVTSILGFRNRDKVFWQDRFQHWSQRCLVCTDDGSYGPAGLVTDALHRVIQEDPPDLVIAIGPLAMMRACAEVTRQPAIRTMVSLNAIMVDGTGMCGSCRVTLNQPQGGKQVAFACVQGPDFDAHRVDFAELIARQRRFQPAEQDANRDFAHLCQLEDQLLQQQLHNYKKIRELEPKQVPLQERDPQQRAQDFAEVNHGYSWPEALREAERCIQCAQPSCIAGCPVHNDIPRFIRHILVRDLPGALATLHETNAFPSICGRVCPQETQCEAQCIIGKKVEPVAIGRLERFVGDHAQPGAGKPAEAQPLPPAVLGQVAVVGSGPAGLAAAVDLRRLGCQVTVFEALHVVGGVLRYGIPAFRLPREVIAREIQQLRDLGVHLETNKIIGKTFTVPELMANHGFDAVFVGAGAGAPSFLGIPGEFAGQVLSANELLTRVNLMGGDPNALPDTPVGLGDDVVVIGAGNTAMDCLRVAKRVGARRVRCVYRRSEAEAPARKEELRHAKEEGIEFLFQHAPVEILLTDQGNVCGLRVETMELGEPDARGRRQPLPTGQLADLPCDTVVYALGTGANPIVPQATPGLVLNRWGNIEADEHSQATSVPGVFAGGDIVTGGATVILAMGAGRRAATAIAAWLQAGKPHWPVSDADLAAFRLAASAAKPAATAPS